MENRTVGLARVDDLEDRAGGRFDHAAVADLAAAFGIEGRFGGYQEDAAVAVAMHRDHFGLGVVAMVSDEARSRTRTEFYFWGDRIVLTRGASALALLFHQAVELHYVDLDSVAAQNVLRQIERKAVRVVELESDFAGKRMAIRLPEPRALGLDEFESTVERFAA